MVAAFRFIVPAIVNGSNRRSTLIQRTGTKLPLTTHRSLIFRCNLQTPTVGESPTVGVILFGPLLPHSHETATLPLYTSGLSSDHDALSVP